MRPRPYSAGSGSSRSTRSDLAQERSTSHGRISTGAAQRAPSRSVNEMPLGAGTHRRVSKGVAPSSASRIINEQPLGGDGFVWNEPPSFRRPDGHGRLPVGATGLRASNQRERWSSSTDRPFCQECVSISRLSFCLGGVLKGSCLRDFGYVHSQS